jgi:hypothetical protein
LFEQADKFVCYVFVIPTVAGVFLQLCLCCFRENPATLLVINKTAEKFGKIRWLLFTVRLEVKYPFYA